MIRPTDERRRGHARLLRDLRRDVDARAETGPRVALRRVAAALAVLRDDPADARRQLEVARVDRPADAGLRGRLGAFLLAQDAAPQAAAALLGLGPAWWAEQVEILARLGRHLDAAERAEAAIRDGRVRHPGAIRAALAPLTVLGDPGRLRWAIDRLGRPAAALPWLLATGDFEAAALEAAAHRHGPERETALFVLAIAAAQLDRRPLARQAVRRLAAGPRRIDARTIAGWWLDALLARTLRDQAEHEHGGHDRNPGVLQPLLRRVRDDLRLRAQCKDDPVAGHLAGRCAAFVAPAA